MEDPIHLSANNYVQLIRLSQLAIDFLEHEVAWLRNIVVTLQTKGGSLQRWEPLLHPNQPVQIGSACRLPSRTVLVCQYVTLHTFPRDICPLNPRHWLRTLRYTDALKQLGDALDQEAMGYSNGEDMSGSPIRQNRLSAARAVQAEKSSVTTAEDKANVRTPASTRPLGLFPSPLPLRLLRDKFTPPRSESASCKWGSLPLPAPKLRSKYSIFSNRSRRKQRWEVGEVDGLKPSRLHRKRTRCTSRSTSGARGGLLTGG